MTIFASTLAVCFDETISAYPRARSTTHGEQSSLELLAIEKSEGWLPPSDGCRRTQVLLAVHRHRRSRSELCIRASRRSSERHQLAVTLLTTDLEEAIP